MSEGDADENKNMILLPCVVCWDVVDFPFPSGLAPRSIYNNMKSYLLEEDYYGDLSIRVYVDMENFTDELRGGFEEAGFTIVPREGKKSHRTPAILLDIALWAALNPMYLYPRGKIIVFTKNTEDEEEGVIFCRELQTFANINYDVETSELLNDSSFDWLYGGSGKGNSDEQINFGDLVLE